MDRDLKSFLETLGNKFLEPIKVKVFIFLLFRNSFIKYYPEQPIVMSKELYIEI